MKGHPTITTLRDFVNLYGTYKSDIEIASLLDISIDDIEIARLELDEDLNPNSFSKVENVI